MAEVEVREKAIAMEQDECGGCGTAVLVPVPPEVCNQCGGSGRCPEHGWEPPACSWCV